MSSPQNTSSADQVVDASELPSSLVADDHVCSLNQLKLRLSQLEMQLSRLAVAYGLDYGALQKLAPSFLRLKAMLLQQARPLAHDGDLVDLAEALLTEAAEYELGTLETLLKNLRTLAHDPSKQSLAPSYRSLMIDLLQLERDIQAALQKALGNIAG